MWQEYINLNHLGEALQILAKKRENARIVAGATDLLLEIDRGVRKDIHTLLDISRVPGLAAITKDHENRIHLGPMVTHNDCISSKLLREEAFLLAKACWEIGSPQIRNRGTVAGNLLTASPANDTIPALIALEASIQLRSVRGSRVLRLADFFRGVRKTVMEPDEMLTEIWFPALEVHQRGVFLKNALRKSQAISVVNAAVVLTFEDVNLEKIQSARMAFGSVAPTIIRAEEAEKYLVGKLLTQETIVQSSLLASKAVSPISDIRSSLEYRKKMVEVYTKRCLEGIASKSEKEGFPEQPVLLRTSVSNGKDAFHATSNENQSIRTTINGKDYNFPSGRQKTLLHLLREDAHLMGSKEGCGEGECGACTLFLDGAAVMGCLVPAGRADGAEITTIEGLAPGETLHPVQQAFIDEGAVQCGYCTPGFVMSSVKLLEEFPNPTVDQIKQAITGNLCRCTGYYSIVKAIEQTVKK